MKKAEIINILTEQLNSAQREYRDAAQAYEYYSSFKLPETAKSEALLNVAAAKLIQIECICMQVGLIETGTI